MPWKVREDGTIEIENGNPVYIHPDGKETPFDADGAMKTINKYRLDSKATDKQIREYKEKIDSYSQIQDIDSALKALEIVKNLDDKKLVDANQVEILKNEMARTYTEKEGILRNQWSQKENEYQNEIKKKEDSIYSLMLNGKFASSPFVREKTVIPPDIAATFFGKNFKVEGEGSDIKIVGYLNGERIASREKFGEAADFEEALEAIVSSYPHKDTILRSGGGMGGSGSTGNTKTIQPKATQFISPDDKKSFGDNLERIAKGEVRVAR